MISNLPYECDFHVHSIASPCASREMTLQAIVDTCTGREIKLLGITDHITATIGPSILWNTREALSQIDKPMQVYLGCEADVLGVGTHTVTDEMVAELDYVAVAANHFGNTGVARPKSERLRDIADHYISMFEYACSLEFADVVVHPVYVMPGSFDPECLDLIDEASLAAAITMARNNGIAMEISRRSLDANQMEFRMRFLRMCKDIGVKFSLGSDSHRLVTLGEMRVLAPLIEKLELNDSDIWLPKGVVR